VARAALDAGACAVIACMWPVADLYAARFMTTLHVALARERRHGRVDLRRVLDHARGVLIAELSGEAMSRAAGHRREGPRPWPHAALRPADPALAWAPFILLGDPYLSAAEGCPPPLAGAG
jgi:CHAT domain-containing protein